MQDNDLLKEVIETALPILRKLECRRLECAMVSFLKVPPALFTHSRFNGYSQSRILPMARYLPAVGVLTAQFV